MPKGNRGGHNNGGGSGGGVAAATAKMPDLKGTPKQVAWAETIRGDFLKNVDLLVNNAKRYADLSGTPNRWNPSVESAKEVRSQAITTMQSITSAPQIINNRSQLTYQFLVKWAAGIDGQKLRRS